MEEIRPVHKIRPRPISFVFLLVFAGRMASGQNASTTPSLSESAVSCRLAMVNPVAFTGSAAYVRLRNQLEALKIAQSVFEGTANGQEPFMPPYVGLTTKASIKLFRQRILCAAFVAGRDRSQTGNDHLFQMDMVTAYNQEAQSLAAYEAIAYRRGREPTLLANLSQSVNENKVRSMSSLQQHAGESIARISAQMLSQIVDQAVPPEADVRITLLDCDEFNTLQRISVIAAAGQASAYANAAKLFVTFFAQHSCKNRAQ